MKTAGIVCEYNPLHNGHVYQIEQTRKCGATHIAAVMSGNFVQRGSCAIMDKWTRADAAIHCGADLVVLLPVPWSLDSAQNFAFGAVSVLEKLGIDFLSFGCETNSKELLLKAAEASENSEVGAIHRQNIKNGMSYPLALSDAARQVYGKETATVLSAPNNTLAVEYIKALKKLKSKAQIIPVKRVGTSHNSESLCGEYASASAIRNETENIGKIKPFMPEYSFSLLKKQIDSGFAPCSEAYAERLILGTLRTMSKEEYRRILSGDRELCDRIYSCVKSSVSLEQLYFSAKTKNVTLSKVRRSVLRLFLEIENEISTNEVPFVRVLAANERGLEILKNVKEKAVIITKHSETKNLDAFSKRVYAAECAASDLYALFSKKIGTCQNELTSPALFIKNK